MSVYRTIGPLVLYFVSGSKTIISYLSSISPAGCYTSVLNWFKDKTSKEVVCPADNDVITFFLITIKCLRETCVLDKMSKRCLVLSHLPSSLNKAL